MKFYTTLFFSCCALVMTAQNGFLDDMKSKWENVSAYTIEFAQVMPEELYEYKPTDAEMTFAEQLVHICGNMTWLCGSYLGGEPLDVDLANAPKDKTALIEMVQQCFDYAAKTIENIKASDLDTEVDFFAGAMSKRRIMFLLTDHVTHHRGQLVVYLRMNNIQPPRYRGW